MLCASVLLSCIVQERPRVLLKLHVMDNTKLVSDVDPGTVMTGLATLLAKPSYV